MTHSSSVSATRFGRSSKAFVAIFLIFVASSCTTKPTGNQGATPVASSATLNQTAHSSTSSAGVTASTSAFGALPPGAKSETESVYPALTVPANAQARTLCKALHDLPEERRSSCCKQTAGVVVTAECERMLHHALEAKAITIEQAKLDGCVKAIGETYQGCDWVGPFPPPLPSACAGLTRGTLASGKTCRSSLECEGSLRCKGVGPTTLGVCSEAGNKGESCGSTVDPLATYMRATDLETSHPSCKSYCARYKCADLGEKDAKCTQTRDCGEGLQCQKKKCVVAPPGKKGEACPAGVCEPGLLCMRGKCEARKAAGEACKTDFECLGGCVKAKSGDFASIGKCGMRCDLR
jgi:hypothetical protein